MKKLSLVFILVALMAVCLVGATAFADSGVVTYENIYIGEYDHGHPDYPNEKEVVIVFGQASVEESANVTSRGIVVTKGDQKFYFPAKSGMVDENGRFGVALVKATILDGDFTAKAYATVGGTYNAETKWWDGATIDEGTTELELAIDNVQISQTQTEITVTKDQSVDLKELITISGAEKSDLTYTTQTEDTAAVDIADGVVSYKSGHGTVTITATHVLSGESVSFTSTVWEKVIEVKDKESFLSLAQYPNAYAYFTSDVEFWHEDVTGKKSILGDLFNGVIDGQGYTLSYNREKEELSWYGIVDEIGEDSIIKNLVFELDAHVWSQYNSVLANHTYGLIENCYIRTNLVQTKANSNDNGMSIQSINRHFGGSYKNVIIENLTSYPIAIDGYARGRFENVAWIAPTMATNYVNGIWQQKFTNDQMNNLCYYSSFDNFVAGTGAVVSLDEETNDYVQTAFETTPQDLGSAWTVDSTNGVSLNGKNIRVITLPEVSYLTTATGSIVFTEAGQTEQIKVYYNENYDEHFTYVSSNSSVATVDESGLVTAIAAGNAKITVTHHFTGKSTTIPVTFADAVIEINNAEELTSLTQAKATELGASGVGTIYAYLGNDITVTKADMPYYVSSSKNYYSILPMGEFSDGKKTSTSNLAYMGVLDGKGYKITYTFEAETANDYFYGISATIGSTTIIRNLSYEGTATVMVWSGARSITNVNNGYIDNCFVNTGFANVNMESYNSTNFSKWVHPYGAPIFTNYGIVRNSVIKNVWAERGTKRTGLLVANAQDGSAVENVAGINTSVAMMGRSGSTFAYAKTTDFRNLCYYATMSDFLSGNGKLLTMAAVDSTSTAQKSYNRTYYGTPLLQRQGLFGWTIDSTEKTIAITVDGKSKVVYTDKTAPTITITASATTMTVGETIDVVALEGGVASENVLLMVNQLSTVATCSQEGVVTAVSAGTINVVAYNPLTGEMASIEITIEAAAE